MTKKIKEDLDKIIKNNNNPTDQTLAILNGIQRSVQQTLGVMETSTQKAIDTLTSKMDALNESFLKLADEQRENYELLLKENKDRQLVENNFSNELDNIEKEVKNIDKKHCDEDTKKTINEIVSKYKNKIKLKKDIIEENTKKIFAAIPALIIAIISGVSCSILTAFFMKFVFK